jgi:ankyrin repeat protein
MRLPENDSEMDRLWLESRRKDIRKERDASKRLRSFARIGDLESVLQLLPEHVYAFCAGAHPRLGAASPVRLLPRALRKVIVLFAHEPIAINAADEHRGLSRGGTALHHACEDGHCAVAAALIRNGADINARRYLGETVLMAACAARRGDHGLQRPDLDMARLILESGADVNLGSPLFRAAFCNHVDVVRLLLEFRAEVDRRDAWGKTPLIAASEEGHDDVVRVLLDAGADVDANEENGKGALYYACSAGHTSTAQLLLDRGADVSARNGRDPFRPVLSSSRAIPHEDKRKIGEALLATMRARTARLEAENADLKAWLVRYEARGD